MHKRFTLTDYVKQLLNRGETPCFIAFKASVDLKVIEKIIVNNQLEKLANLNIEKNRCQNVCKTK